MNREFCVLSNRSIIPIITYKSTAWLSYFWLSYAFSGTNCVQKFGTACIYTDLSRYYQNSLYDLGPKSFHPTRAHAYKFFKDIILSTRELDVNESVRHSIIHIGNPSGCNSVTKFYFIFIWGSTCFGRHTALHQEPKTALAASGFAYVERCWRCSCWTASSNYTSNNPSAMVWHDLVGCFLWKFKMMSYLTTRFKGKTSSCIWVNTVTPGKFRDILYIL
jgi:hypothetical protein